MGSRSLALVLLVITLCTPAAFADWEDAHATFYGEADGLTDGPNTMGGACGYDKYNVHTTALSAALFQDGATCGACFEIQCVNSQWCVPGAGSITVTATNFCPKNVPGKTAPWCNYPNKHFDMSRPAWESIGIYSGGVIPVQFRRVACTKMGGIRFTLNGNPYYNMFLISNVAGAGDVTALAVKSDSTYWLPMQRNWGQNWLLQDNLGQALPGQSLSFQVTVSDGSTLTLDNVIPPNWNYGQTFEAPQNF